MGTQLQYLPRMRQRPVITSSLSAPLALSSVVLLVLMTVATSSLPPRTLHRSVANVASKDSRSDMTPLHQREAPTPNEPVANLVVARPHGGTTATTVPQSVEPSVANSAMEGVVSGGDLSMSLVTIEAQRSFQLHSDHPLEITAWDGSCTIDQINNFLTNASTQPCTVALHGTTFTTWQLVALA